MASESLLLAVMPSSRSPDWILTEPQRNPGRILSTSPTSCSKQGQINLPGGSRQPDEKPNDQPDKQPRCSSFSDLSVESVGGCVGHA